MGRIAEATTPPAEALELNESASLLLEESATRLIPEEKFKAVPGSVFDEHGRVPVVVIRPGIGKGRGRHLYEASMLEENAPKFMGWKQYVDHLSPDARRAAGGLPRSVRDLGGRLTETWWEPGFELPEDELNEHGKGAVLGLAKPVPFIRELIESDPELVVSSISASATGVRPVTRGGQKVWLVEGINDHGSLDWVTEAGAGGRVVTLMEAAYNTPEAVDEVLLESMDDDSLLEHLKRARPELLEAMGKGKKADCGDDEKGGDGDLDKHIARLKKKGMPHAMAEKAARKALSETTNPKGDDVAEVTTEQLQEALSENPNLLVEALQNSSEVQLFVNGLVEAKLEEERPEMEAKADAKASRQLLVRDMRDAAHDQIAEAKLPESFARPLLEKYALTEAGPSPALDVADETDDDGKVTKPALKVLAEAVTADIEAERERLAEANPTRIRHQGAQRPAEGGAAAKSENRSHKGTGWGKFLQESGVDPDKAFALQGAGE